MITYFVLGTQLGIPANPNRVPSPAGVILPAPMPALIEATEVSVFNSTTDKVETTLRAFDRTTHKSPVAIHLLTIPIPANAIPATAEDWIKGPFLRDSVAVFEGNLGPYVLNIHEPLACGAQVVLEFTKPE